MKIRCAWCEEMMGEKEPLDDPRITDTMCPECYQRELEKVPTGIGKEVKNESDGRV